MQTRSQQYACAAFDKVDHVKGSSDEKEYGALALKFPVMVLQSGLAQASGFILAKKKERQLRYLNDLADVLGQSDGDAFHKKVIKSSLADYQRLTRHTLDAAGWFKRYAQGHLDVEITDVGDVS
jgi:CRISPR-associated protein Cmr5